MEIVDDVVIEKVAVLCQLESSSHFTYILRHNDGRLARRSRRHHPTVVREV
jgi:hypothetical protein